MDSAPPNSSNRLSLSNPKLDGIQQPELYLKQLSGLDIQELWQEADAVSVGLRKDELAAVLLTLGAKYNYGLAPGTEAIREQIASFWQALRLQDLALAHACALGREPAWRQFIARFRTPLRQAAIAITASAERGQELADSLYAELFGLRDSGRSPLAYYSGRGSLNGFLRTTLAQRNVDDHRRVSRETSLTDEDPPASPTSPVPTSEMLARLSHALTATLGSLAAEERFLLSAWFLDRRTMLEISRVLGVHEATVSRRLSRLTATLRENLLQHLQASGMSRAAAEESLTTDPRDLDVNLRTLLQASRPATFQEQGLSAEPGQT